MKSPPTSGVDVITAVGTGKATNTNTNTPTNLMDLIDPILRNIGTYLSNADLMNLSPVSKRTYEVVPRATTYESRAPGTIITILHLGPSSTNKNSKRGGRGRLEQLVHQLQLRSHRNLLRRYQHVSMKGYHEFKNVKYHALVRQIKTHGPQIEGITSLDFCVLPTRPTPTINEDEEMDVVFDVLTYLLPSLREVDFTNTCARNSTFCKFFKNCPCLEKFTFNNNHPTADDAYGIDGILRGILRRPHLNSLNADGGAMKSANNLKELIIDNSTLVIFVDEADYIFDLENENNNEAKLFLFYKCSSKVLERVSLRNTAWCAITRAGIVVQTLAGHLKAIQQKALIKFIRNAPTTLRWFRSNLTTENIKMLHHERPEIEFVS